MDAQSKSEIFMNRLICSSHSYELRSKDFFYGHHGKDNFYEVMQEADCPCFEDNFNSSRFTQLHCNEENYEYLVHIF